MQPQDINSTFRALIETAKAENRSAVITFIIDGLKVNTPDYELRLVDGATLIRILDLKGKCYGVFDVRSVAGIVDRNWNDKFIEL